jgi:hypothetical protein
MPTLFEKSGADGTYRRFKFEIQRIAARDDLPGYLLALSQQEGEPLLHMVRRDQMTEAQQAAWKTNPPVKPRPAAKPEKAPDPSPLPLLRPILRFLSEDTVARVRADFPGWDVYTLKAEFDSWLDEDPAREPKNYEAAFYGFVKQHNRRNLHQLARS